MGRYLDAPISPMTLPMDNNTERFLHTLNIRGAQDDGMSVRAVYIARIGQYKLKKNQRELVSLVALRNLSVQQLSARPLNGINK